MESVKNFLHIYFDIVLKQLYNNIMNKKEILLLTYLYLKENSDEENPKSIKDILNFLDKNNLSATRQTCYCNIKTIVNLDIGIYKSDSFKNTYFYDDCEFDSSEISWLCYSILDNNLISKKHSNDLIKKLLNLKGGGNLKKNLSKFNIINPDKKENKEVFYNLSIIMEALNENTLIEFDYLIYNHNKKLVKKREKKYQEIPLGLTIHKNKPFVVTYKYNQYKHYRVDRIINITKSDQLVVFKPKLDLQNHFKYHPYNYSGELIEFKAICDDTILDELIEFLGTHIIITKHNNNKFQLKTKLSKNEIIFLLSQFIQFMTIIEPQNIKEEFINILKNKIK